MNRVKVEKAVGDGLLARYRQRAEAEVILVQYLRGVVDVLGIPAEAVEGFDDETGELLLADAGGPVAGELEGNEGEADQADQSEADVPG